MFKYRVKQKRNLFFNKFSSRRNIIKNSLTIIVNYDMFKSTFFIGLQTINFYINLMPGEQNIFTLVNVPELKYYQYLLRKSINIGDNIISYIKKTHQIQIPDSFIACCSQLDQIRNIIISEYQIPDNEMQLYADYCKILTGVTKDINMSDANIKIKWGNTVLSNVNFEICCMGYNVCVGICNSLSKISFNDQSSLQKFIEKTQIAKAIVNKVIECYDESYNIMPIQNIRMLSSIIDAFYLHSAVGKVLLTNPKGYALLAKVSKGAADKYAECQMNDYSIYFRILSNVKMAEDCFAKSEFGNGIAFGSLAFSLVPNTKPKRGETDIKKFTSPILVPFKVTFDQNKKDNERIYFDRVPPLSELPEIVPSKLQCTPKYNWESNINVPELHSQVTNTSFDEIQMKFDNIKNESSKALADIEDSLRLYPEQIINQIEQEHTNLSTARNNSYNLINIVENKINQNQQILNQMYPEAYQHLNLQKYYLDESSKADNYYEGEYNKLLNSIQPLREAYQSLTESKNGILSVLNESQQIYDEAMNAVQQQANPQSIVSISTKASNDFTSLAGRLNSIFSFLGKQNNDMHSFQIPQSFGDDSQKVNNAFNEGSRCYNLILRNLQKMQSKFE